MKTDVNKKPLVSVIVPVFNTEAYIEQCLHSLCTQTLNEIEIIVIDDGSTDSSGQICDTFAEKDSRFTVIHKNNEGLSAAKNEGIKIAQADYIMFVDSDDWVESDFCKMPYYLAETTKADLVVFQYSSYNKRKPINRSNCPIEGIISNEEALTRLWKYVAVNSWNKLYHSELFEKIRFPVGYECEDTAVTHHLVYNARKIYLMNSVLYHHRDYRLGSITNIRSEKFIEDGILFGFKKMDDYKRWGLECEEETETALWYLAVKGRHGELSDKCNKILCSNRKKENLYWKWRIMLYLHRLSPRLFDFVSVISGKRAV